MELPANSFASPVFGISVRIFRYNKSRWRHKRIITPWSIRIFRSVVNKLANNRKCSSCSLPDAVWVVGWKAYSAILTTNPGPHYDVRHHGYKPVVCTVLGCSGFPSNVLLNIINISQPDSCSVVVLTAANNTAHHVEHHVCSFRADGLLSVL